MNLTTILRFRAAMPFVAGLTLATSLIAPAPAAAKIYDVGIFYDVTPPYSDRFCPMHVRFRASVSAKLAPGQSRDITYHWETGKGKKFPDHTMTLPPDMHIDQPAYHKDPSDPYAPTPIPAERNQDSKGLSFHMTRSFQDRVIFVITQPVHEVTNGDNLDILCR